jgi:hypothetical protein
MTPEDVCASLAHPHKPAPPSPGELPPDKADDILANISASYFMLRRGMALIAFAFPVLLWVGGGLEGSLSAYYHADGGRLRDVFVGVLWAIGSFLALYRGYSTAEDRALNVAGLAAVAVSLAPMDWPRHSVETATGALHYAAAIGFFLAIAYVCLFRSGDTLALMRDEGRAARFRATYRVLGWLMALLPPAVWAIHRLLPRPDEPIALFFVEAAGVYVFAAFWTVKSREIAVLERQ